MKRLHAKKIITVTCAFLSLVTLLSTLMFSAFAVDASGDQVMPRATCTNHNFSIVYDVDSVNKWHILKCANSNCTAFMTEDCYFHDDCYYYPNDDYKLCQGCNRVAVAIHNYEYVHDTWDDEKRHILTCTNYESEYVIQCGKTSGEYIDCSLGVTTVWRGFKVNNGHYLKRDCGVCEYSYTVGYCYPYNHPNYYNSNHVCYS